EEDRLEMARDLLRGPGANKIALPSDALVSASLDGSDPGRVVDARRIPEELMGVDIGPATRARFAAILEEARTVLWNGPMGIFEVPAFAEGTLSVARALAGATRKGATTIVGGGDSAAAIATAGLDASVSHVSTGGGASLEFLEGKVLPGVAALAIRG
ncbi:MAG: phosphoglycerate kinase, partial [Candidatus Eisenbacteria bacterium]